MVQDFLNNKLKDFKNFNKPKFISIDADTNFSMGNNFKLIPYRVNHSVPNTLGFFLQTPAGVVVHQTDFKFDWTPVMDKPADVQKIAALAKELQPTLLLSDSLGSTSPGFTKSERFIEDTFDLLVKEAPRQVFITTMSSNISRIQQAINSGVKFGRKVVTMGYSIESNLEVALKYNLIQAPPDTLISEDEIKNYPDERLLFVVPGNYGQVGSTLDKIGKKEHKKIKLHDNALVIFSGDPIPGTEPAVDRLIDNLTLAGAHVVYSELQENLHVSGHGSRGDLSLMAQIIKPKFFYPIGGGIKHMRAYKDMLAEQGFIADNIFELLNGESLELEGDYVRKGAKIEIKDVYIDVDKSKSSIENIVLADRKLLAENGVIFVVVPYRKGVPLAKRVDIYTRGYIYVKANQAILNGMKKNAEHTIKSLMVKGPVVDSGVVKKVVEKALSKHLAKRVGKAPSIIVEKLEL